MRNRNLTLIRSFQSSEEAGRNEVPLPLGNVTSANSTTFDTVSNPTDLGLGGRPLKLDQRVGVVVL